jgi:uncharacterized protein
MPPAKPQASRPTPASRRTTTPEVVDPVWLAKALSLSLVAALLCGYATLCLLVYQGAWQLILHPSHTIDRTPASAGLVYSDVRFDASETGQPRLTAWWIPTAPEAGFQARHASFTILYLHDGSGSLSNSVPMLALLHRAGLNIFAIDYRGFGASDSSVHPSEVRMTQDAAAALEYLTATLHIPTRDIIPYGVGLGASLAANLAQANGGLAAVILDNPDPDPASTAAAAKPSRVIPVRLLFGNKFDIKKAIATLGTPKLLIAGGPNSANAAADLRVVQLLFKQAASPSFAVTLPSVNFEDDWQMALDRFLDQYLSAKPQSQ